MTTPAADAAAAAAHMLRFAGEDVVLGGQTMTGFVNPDSVVSSENVRGGKSITQSLTLIVSKEDHPARPKLRSRATVRGGVFYVQEAGEALGIWELELDRDKGR